MEYQKIMVWALAFLQWISLPLLVVAMQNVAANVLHRHNLFLDVIICLITMAIVLLGPLSLMGMLPLGDHAIDYLYAAAPGVLLSIPLTRFIRNWFAGRNEIR
jgi:hypothetical protein